MKLFALRFFYTAIFSLLFISYQLKAQDPTWSQHYFNQMYVNPAFTGINSGLRLTANYRDLWPRIPSKFPTYNFAIDAQDLSSSSGIGLTAWSDNEGEGYLRTQCISGLYSYRVILSPKNWIFQGGFQTSVVSKRIDWSRLLFSDQLHPLFGVVGPTANVAPNQENTTFVDFSAGALIRGNHRNRVKQLIATYTFGFAIHHLIKPDESIIGQTSQLPRNYVAHASAVIPVRFEVSRNKIMLAPSLLYESQSTMSEFIATFNVLMQPLFAGLSYRNQYFNIFDLKHSDAIIVNFGFNNNYNKDQVVYKLGYSYDLTISDLRSASHGTHELALVVEFRDFKFDNRPSAKKKLECPDF